MFDCVLACGSPECHHFKLKQLSFACHCSKTHDWLLTFGSDKQVSVNGFKLDLLVV